MSKYHARKVTDDGVTFDSMAEHRRYCQLKLLLSAGEIVRLEVHPRYPLVVNGVKVCTYEADFRYRDGTRTVVEDVKGVKTPAYIIKRKLMKAIYDIDILETHA